MGLVTVPLPMRLALVVVPLSAVPLLVAGVARLVGTPISILQAVSSVGLFFAAWPIAQLLLSLLGHRGGHDAIHALKSGAVMPLVVIALGLLFLAPPRSR
ncbi:MAG: hypothetical protein ACI8S6_004414 [Myxococcota bacterium]|jgi:hypothetical protein